MESFQLLPLYPTFISYFYILKYQNTQEVVIVEDMVFVNELLNVSSSVPSPLKEYSQVPDEYDVKG